MIRDKHIKKYILSKLCKYIYKDIRIISSSLVGKLERKFIKDESVILNNGRTIGTVYDRNGTVYSVITTDNKSLIENIEHKELRRFDNITFDLIYNFIFQITEETPFGIRLLKKNVFNVLIFNNLVRNKTSTISKSITSEKIILKPEDETPKKNNIIQHRKLLYINEDSDFKHSQNEPNDVYYREINTTNYSVVEMKKNNIDVLFNILPSEKIIIKGLSNKSIRKLVDIFSFIKKFINQKMACNITIDKFLSCLQEPTYNSDLIRDTHTLLIDSVLKEVKSMGLSTYIKSIQNILDGLLEDGTIEESRRKNDIGLKSWKIKAREFLWEINAKTLSKEIYKYYSMLSKKKNYETEEAVRTRLDLLDFFIACYYKSKAYQNIICDLEKDLEVNERIYQEIVKNIKLNQEAKLANNDLNIQSRIYECEQRLLQDLKHVKLKMFYNPLKDNLGTLNGAQFKFIDGDVYVMKDYNNYLLNRNSLDLIVACYHPRNPTEEDTIINLKKIIEAIYQ